ncbi:MAG: SdrD B-like domain-containing protein [Caldilineaceae bacterium]
MYRLRAEFPKLVVMIELTLWFLLAMGIPVQAHVAPFITASCQSVNTLFCNVRSVTDNKAIAGTVWKDENGDGLRQLSDPFIPYATVQLFQSQATELPLLTATTTITGWYQFDALAEGNYYVEFSTPGHMLPTLPNQGANEAVDSDATRIDMTLKSRSAPVHIGQGGGTTVIDAGFVLPATLTTYIYRDDNRDGQRQLGEATVANTTLILYDDHGSELVRAIVDEDGSYRFLDLFPGQYWLEILPPANFDPAVSGVAALPFLAPGANQRYEVPVIYHAPNVIELSSFSAQRVENGLRVRWITAAEFKTIGYRVQRVDGVSAATATAVSSGFIKSQGNNGGVYELTLDYNPIYDGPVAAIQFWLVEYEAGGQENRYGPFAVTEPMTAKLYMPFIVR